MKPEKKPRKDRRRHRRRDRHSNEDYAAARPPSDRGRSRTRSNDRYQRRRRFSRRHHSTSRSGSHNRKHRRRDRSYSRHRRRRRRDEENDGESAAFVSDDSDDDRKYSHADIKSGGDKRNTKYKTEEKQWGSSWADHCGTGERYYSPSSSPSREGRRNRRMRRSRGSRERRRKKTRSTSSRSSSSDYYYDSRGRGGNSGRKRKRGERRGRRKDEQRKRNNSSGNQSDSSRDDTTGHFKGGPGTKIGEQYRIVRDVGLGTFGRVVECSKGDSRVAIKIVRNVRRYYDSALIEADICERVNREQRRHNKDLCAKMLDRFGLPSGHYCLVFERLGRSLYDFLKDSSRPFPIFCCRDFSRQLLEALDFLHGFGLIHTDLKPENILLTYDDREHRETPSNTKVKVIDFGGATFDNEKKSSIVNTRQYRAPEVILGYSIWSYPSDLWSAGCIMAELYTGNLLFQTHDNAEHLALMEKSCGKFTRDLLERATSPLARECFDSRGWHRLKGVLSSRSADHVKGQKQIERVVKLNDRPSGLGELLGSLLTLDPKDRASARQALGCRFFH